LNRRPAIVRVRSHVIGRRPMTRSGRRITANSLPSSFDPLSFILLPPHLLHHHHHHHLLLLFLLILLLSLVRVFPLKKKEASLWVNSRVLPSFTGFFL